MTTENKLQVETLKVEGFNPDDFAQPYDENPDESYLPYDIQRWWFNTVYPNGRICVSAPQPDPERTPGAYVATATVWKNKNDEHEDITISNRAVVSETSTVDPYQDCQRKAISLALKTLGFWLSPSKIIRKPMVDPEKLGTDEQVANSMVPDTEDQPAPKKRGRKPKTHDVDASPAEEKAVDVAKTEEVKPAETSVKKSTDIEPAHEVAVHEEPVVEAKTEETEASVAEPESVQEEKTVEPVSTMSVEEARKVTVSYRNFAGRTIGDLFDSENKRDRELLNWFATSERAQNKYVTESEAAKVMLASEN